MEKSTRVAIVLHGNYGQPNDIRTWCDEADKVVAADGAADVLLELGISPDFVIGDMDGIRADTLQELDPGTVLPQDDQNTTDFQKCLRFCKENFQFESIAVLNFEGKRVDHMLSALYSSFERVRFVGSDALGLVLSAGEHEISARKGIRISLMPMPEANVAWASGLLYDPSGLELKIGGRDGISNEATADSVRLSISSGTLLAFVQRFEGETRW